MSRKTAEQLLEEQEQALIMDAIADTEQEIFDDALNLDPADNDGDRSLEEMDGEDVLDSDAGDDGNEAEDAGEDAGEDGADDAGEETDPEAGEEEPPVRHDDRQDDRQDDRRGVPPQALREERERRRAIEAEREQARAEARELRARLDALERAQQTPPRPAQSQEPPDLFADPDARLRWEREQIARDFETRRINSSFDDARREHGDRFVNAFRTLQASQSPALVREITASNNPGRALMDWYGRHELLSEIGDDPAAYRQRIRDELLADPEIQRSVIEGARRNALRGDGGRPRTQTRLPPSLNSAPGGSSHRAGVAAPRGGAGYSGAAVEREIADSVWD